MKFSQLFTKTKKELPKDEVSVNAQLLERGGFIYKNSAGIYTFLPLGWKVINKVANIIKEEMNKIGGQEIFMPALVEKKYMDATGRWDIDVGFKIIEKSYFAKASQGAQEQNMQPNFVLGWTHEEVLTEIATKFINSYKDLPFAAYQIQAKFRNEPRAKSGLLREREFLMKDLYSFHESEEDFLAYYQQVKEAYYRIFHRCGLKAIYTLAGGGAFTSGNTHEFQVLSSVGEDTIIFCSDCEYAENQEISKLKKEDKCTLCEGKAKEEKAIEVGNIFPLGTKYSQAFNLQFVNELGEKKFVVMGSYGIGLGRLMGTVVEIHHDKDGILWPESVAPFKFHLIALEGAEKETEEVYEKLTHQGAEVLYDNRQDKTAGEKFADADLLGMPIRIVVSKKTLEKNSAEVKRRNEKEFKLVLLTEIGELL